MSIIYPNVDLKKALREELREELRRQDTFELTKYLEAGVDAFFTCRAGKHGEAGDYVCKASDFWVTRVSEPYTYDQEKLVKPKEYSYVSFYTRRAFRYGSASVYMKLPDLTIVGPGNYAHAWVGFENEESGNMLAFQLFWNGSAESLRLHAQSNFMSARNVDLTNLVDLADLKANYRVYTLMHTENIALFYQGAIYGTPVLKGVALFGTGMDTSISGPPYGILLIREPINGLMPFFIEFSETKGLDMEWLIPAYRTRISEVSRKPSLSLPLYEAGTNNTFAGKSVDSGSLTSHPIPVFGYREVTIHFMADTNSATEGLVVEALTHTGNWRPYYVTTYSANTFQTITVDEHFVLLRLIYSPSTYPASILEGGVTLIP